MDWALAKALAFSRAFSCLSLVAIGFLMLTHFLGTLKIADRSLSSDGQYPIFLSLRYIGWEAIQIWAVSSTSLNVMVVSRSIRGPLPFIFCSFLSWFFPLLFSLVRLILHTHFFLVPTRQVTLYLYEASVTQNLFCSGPLSPPSGKALHQVFNKSELKSWLSASDKLLLAAFH